MNQDSGGRLNLSLFFIYVGTHYLYTRNKSYMINDILVD